MGDWRDRDSLLADLNEHWDAASSHAQNLTININEATAFNLDWYDGSSMWYAQNAIIAALNDIEGVIAKVVYYHWWFEPHFEILYYMVHHTGGAVNWKSICEAWVKNDFEGKEWTIACIDQMRKLMWNKPFDIKWAAKPDTERE